MEQILNYSDLINQSPHGLATVRFIVNVSASMFLLMGLYYRRYRDKELVTTASMFNIFAFGALTILSQVQFSVQAGFGLFAMLALFSLRSEQISKIEITYFFGSLVIAVITSVGGTTLPFMLFVVVLVLAGAYVFDHPRFLRSADGVKITLDKIDQHALSNPAQMRADLSCRLGVDVVSYQITALDYINDMARVSVFFRKAI